MKKSWFVGWMVLSFGIAVSTVLFRSTLPPFAVWLGPVWPIPAFAIGRIAWGTPGERKQNWIALGVFGIAFAFFWVIR